MARRVYATARLAPSLLVPPHVSLSLDAHGVEHSPIPAKMVADVDTDMDRVEQ